MTTIKNINTERNNINTNMANYTNFRNNAYINNNANTNTSNINNNYI
jgi:hypothetical protein